MGFARSNVRLNGDVLSCKTKLKRLYVRADLIPVRTDLYIISSQKPESLHVRAEDIYFLKDLFNFSSQESRELQRSNALHAHSNGVCVGLPNQFLDVRTDPSPIRTDRERFIGSKFSLFKTFSILKP